MDRKKLFKTFAYLTILLFLINQLALKFYWYYSIWYFDMLTHFLGGICLGFAAIWFFSRKNLLLNFDFKLVCKIFLGVLIFSVLWEIYEVFIYNIFAQNPFNALDTISDLFFDLAGGSLAVLYYLKYTMIDGLNKVE